MQAQILVRRVAIGLAIVIGTLFAVGILIVAYAWIKEAPDRAKRKQETTEFMAGLTAQINGWNALQDLEFVPESLTFADLEQKLNKPMLRKAIRNGTTLGWICGGEHCAILASFVTDLVLDIPPNAVPEALTIIAPPFAEDRSIGIASIRIGETPDQVARGLRDRNIVLARKNRIAVGKDWSLQWSEMDGKINTLFLLNEKIMANIKQKGT
jgi:hypothetical protein